MNRKFDSPLRHFSTRELKEEIERREHNKKVIAKLEQDTKNSPFYSDYKPNFYNKGEKV